MSKTMPAYLTVIRTLWCIAALVLTTEAVAQRFIPVQKNGKWGAINSKGKLIIPLQYDYLSDIHPVKQLALIKKGQYMGVIDASGQEVIPASYTSLRAINSQLILARKKGLAAVLDYDGTVVIPSVVDSVSQLDRSKWVIYAGQEIEAGMMFQDSMVIKAGKCGIIGESGIAMTAIDLDSVTRLGYGYKWQLKKGDLVGLMNIKTVTYPVEYQRIDPFYKHHSAGKTFKGHLLTKATGLGLGSVTGKVWLPSEYQDIRWIDHADQNHVRIRQGDKTGVFSFTTNKIVVPVQFDSVAKIIYHIDTENSIRLWEAWNWQKNGGRRKKQDISLFGINGDPFDAPEWGGTQQDLPYDYHQVLTRKRWRIYGPDYQERLQHAKPIKNTQVYFGHILAVDSPDGYYLFALDRDSTIIPFAIKQFVQSEVDSTLILKKEKKGDARYALVGADARMVTGFAYKSIKRLLPGKYRVVSQSGKCGVIDASGQKLLPVSYTLIDPFEEGSVLTRIHTDKGTGVINQRMDILAHPIHGLIEFTDEGFKARTGDKLAIFKLDSKDSVIQQKGYESVLVLKINGASRTAKKSSRFGGEADADQDGTRGFGDTMLKGSKDSDLTQTYNLGSWSCDPSTGLWGMKNPATGTELPYAFEMLDMSALDLLGWVAPHKPVFRDYMLYPVAGGGMPAQTTDTVWYLIISTQDTLWRHDFYKMVKGQERYVGKSIFMDIETGEIKLRLPGISSLDRRMPLPQLLSFSRRRSGTKYILHQENLKYLGGYRRPIFRTLAGGKIGIHPTPKDVDLYNRSSRGVIEKNGYMQGNGTFTVVDGQTGSIIIRAKGIYLFDQETNPENIYRMAYGIEHDGMYLGIGFKLIKGRKSIKTAKVKSKHGYQYKNIVYVGPFVDGIARFNIGGTLIQTTQRRASRSAFQDESVEEIGMSIRDGYSFVMNGITYTIKGGKWGYMNTRSKVVCEPIYDYATSIVDGRAIVRSGDRSGIIDRDMRAVTPMIYHRLEIASKANTRYFIASRKQSSQAIYTPQSGQCSIGRLPTISPLVSEGYSTYQEAGLWGYSDQHGNKITEAIYTVATPYRDGMATVKRGRAWGFVDSQGTETIPARYKRAGYFGEGLAPVLTARGWGMINEAGAFITDTTYHKMGSVDEGYFWAKTSEGYSIMDIYGASVLLSKNLRIKSGFSNGLAIVKHKDKYGLLTPDQKWAVPPVYTTIKRGDGGHIYFLYDQGKPMSIYHVQTHKILPFKIRKRVSSRPHHYYVMIGKRWTLMNQQGQVLAKPTHDHFREVPDHAHYYLPTPSIHATTVSLPILSQIHFTTQTDLGISDTPIAIMLASGTYLTHQRDATSGDQRKDIFGDQRAIISLSDDHGLPRTRPFFQTLTHRTDGSYSLQTDTQYYLLDHDGQPIHQGGLDWIYTTDRQTYRLTQADRDGVFDLDTAWVWSLSR